MLTGRLWDKIKSDPLLFVLLVAWASLLDRPRQSTCGRAHSFSFYFEVTSFELTHGRLVMLRTLPVLRTQRQVRTLAALAASGRVTQVIGAVVDVSFEGEIPKVRFVTLSHQTVSAANSHIDFERSRG